MYDDGLASAREMEKDEEMAQPKENGIDFFFFSLVFRFDRFRSVVGTHFSFVIENASLSNDCIYIYIYVVCKCEYECKCAVLCCAFSVLCFCLPANLATFLLVVSSG